MKGAIGIGIDDRGQPYVRSQFRKELDANDDEMRIAEHFISAISAVNPDAPVSLERRSENYLSLCLGDNDFLRFKYTERAKWLSIDTSFLDIEDDNPLFEAQKNKRQRHWRAKISDIADINKFDEYVIKACR